MGDTVVTSMDSNVDSYIISLPVVDAKGCPEVKVASVVIISSREDSRERAVV